MQCKYKQFMLSIQSIGGFFVFLLIIPYRKANNPMIVCGVLKSFSTFVASEGRNPRVKKAFLALSYTMKSPISNNRRMETMRRSFCLYILMYSPRCTPRGIYDSVGYLLLSSFLLWCLAISIV